MGPTRRKCFLVVGPVALFLWRCLTRRKHFLVVGRVAQDLSPEKPGRDDVPVRKLGPTNINKA
tara:strand:+ start:1689 stop:1877 length:189 start_codon:yes stop_codon:yes gene_type:complete